MIFIFSFPNLLKLFLKFSLLSALKRTFIPKWDANITPIFDITNDFLQLNFNKIYILGSQFGKKTRFFLILASYTNCL